MSTIEIREIPVEALRNRRPGETSGATIACRFIRGGQPVKAAQSFTRPAIKANVATGIGLVGNGQDRGSSGDSQTRNSKARDLANSSGQAKAQTATKPGKIQRSKKGFASNIRIRGKQSAKQQSAKPRKKLGFVSKIRIQ